MVLLFKINILDSGKLVGFEVTPAPLRSHGDFPVLLVEEDLICPSMHYFRQAGTCVEMPTII
jgi:hypothetical protein